MKATTSTRDQLERFMVLVRRGLAFWKRSLAVFVLGALLAVPYVLTRDRTYRSETVILYHETINSTDLTGGEGSGDGARRAGARLRELLLSRASLEPIINELHLYQSLIIRGEMFGAVDEMRKHVTFRAREGDTFEIAFVGSTPTEAQEVTRRLGDCIVQETTTRRSEQAKTLKEFLKTESARNAAELKQKEADLGRFVVLHPDFAPRLQGLPAGAATVPPPGQLAPSKGGDPLLAILEARAFRLERRLHPKDAPPTLAPKPSATFTPPPDSAELVAARKDYADKAARFTDKHPDVVAARNRLKEAESAQVAANQAAAAASAQAAALNDDPGPPKNATDEAALKKELADLQNQIAARRIALAGSTGASDAGADPASGKAPSGAVDSELEFRRLQREVGEARDQQDKLDERLFRASITASSVTNDRNIQVSILDPAYLPVKPVSKPRSLIMAGLLALCLVLAIATAAVSSNLDDRIYDRIDLEKLEILPLLAVIPRAGPPKLRHSSAPPPPDRR